MKAKDLRNSILQLAVQGKLVPQDPNDEPASALLDRIRAERAKLIKEKKIRAPKGGESVIYRASDGSHYEKRGKDEPVCIDDEIPFEIPESWTWVRLGSILELVSDGTHKTPEYKDSGVLFLSVQNISKGYFDLSKAKYVSQETHNELCKRVKPRNGDILLCRIGTLGKPIIVDVDYEFSIFVSLGLLRLIDERLAEWVVACIDAPIGFQWIQRVKVGGGTHTFKINLGDIPDFLIPLPPYEEQLRIREKLSAILDHVGDYEELQDARERLDAELPDRLRKSILQLAVQGKLVEQDPTDEPASALLDRIRADRGDEAAAGLALVKAKKIRAPKGGESIIYRASDGGYYEKRGKGESVCIDDEIPFEIPESWKWVRLESVTVYIQRGKSPKYSPIKKYPVVAQKCNQWSGFSLELAKFVDPSTVSSYAVERILQDGDLLWNSTGLGTLGRMAIYDSSVNDYGWAVADSHVTVIRTMAEWLDYRYAFAYFAGPSVQSVIEDKASGSTKQKELAQETVRSYLVPIPPRREQTRIAEQLSKVLPQLTNQ